MHQSMGSLRSRRVRTRPMKGVLLPFVIALLYCLSLPGCSSKKPDEPGDNSAPMVESTSPAHGETDVAPDQVVTIEFSEDVMASSVTTSTIQVYEVLTTERVPISGTVDCYGSTATFTSSSDWVDTASCAVTLKSGIKDRAGNGLKDEYSFVFSAGSDVDTDAPILVSISPAHNSTDVPANTDIRIKFNEYVLESSVSAANFSVNGGDVSINIAVDRNNVILTPALNLSLGQTYSIEIGSGVADLAGNASGSSSSAQFTTANFEAGSQWTMRVSNTDADLVAVAASSDEFIAVGSRGDIVYSRDGLDWSHSSPFGVQGLYDIVWSGDKFVIVGSYGFIAISESGTEWFEVADTAFHPSRSQVELTAIACSEQNFVAVSSGGTIYVSVDASSWSIPDYEFPESFGTSFRVNDVVWDGSGFVIVGHNYSSFYPESVVGTSSTDGSSWSWQTAYDGLEFSSISYFSSMYIATTTDGILGSVYSSGNATDWTRRKDYPSWPGDTVWYGGAWAACSCASDYLAVVANWGGQVFTSADGTSWTTRVNAVSCRFRGVVSNGQRFVAVGENGCIFTSP